MEYTPEQLNYFRLCYIAFDLVPRGLREIFKQEWDFLYKATPAGEWQDDAQNGQDFYNKESKKSHIKNSRYLATIRKGNSAEWDCSCLFSAILFSDSIGTYLSAAVKKDVDDIRQVRNDIAHIGVAELTDADFQVYVGRLGNAFTSLGLQTIEIDSIGMQTSFPTSQVNKLENQMEDLKREVDTITKELNSKVGSFCNLAIEPSHVVITRSNEVNKIMKKMKELRNGSNGVVSTIYLSGNPGCGKSQLARQIGEKLFATRMSDSKSLTFVATVDAHSLETLADSYMLLARELGITEYALTNAGTSNAGTPKQRIQNLQSFIKQNIRKFSTWLIIADNVVNVNLVRSFLPLTASEEWGQGQVLITTQDSSTIPSNAPHTYHESLKAGMRLDDAVELLKEVSQLHTEEELQKVAEVLDYQPLALAAAAYYVRVVVDHGSPSYSWKEYLETLSKGITKREATEEALAKESDAYSNTMTTAIRLAIRSTVEIDNVFRQLFCFLSLCASDSVPLQAVVKFVEKRMPNQTEEGIRAKIFKSSLILCSIEKDKADSYLQMHRNVYEATRMEQDFLFESSSKRLECIAAAIGVFKSLIPKDCKLVSREQCVFFTRIATHSKALYTHSVSFNSAPGELFPEDLTPFISRDEFVGWLHSLAKVCRELTDLSLAKYFIELSHDLLKYISDTKDGKRLKGNVLTTFGEILSNLSQNKEALSYTEEGMNLLKETFADEDCDVAASYSILGTIYRDTRESLQAMTFHEKALNIRQQIHGEEHGDVAASYYKLGTVYSDVGMHVKAKGLFEKALNISIKTHGEMHGDVATGYTSLGTFYSNRREDDKAKAFHEKALAIRRTIYGEEHGDVATSYSYLATVCSAVGQRTQAKEFYERALMIWKKIYGDRHQNVVTCYANLAFVCSALGLDNEAKEFDEKALIICLASRGNIQ